MRIGTIFESRHAPMHIWLQVTYMICSSKKGFPTRQIQRTLNWQHENRLVFRPSGPRVHGGTRLAGCQ